MEIKEILINLVKPNPEQPRKFISEQPLKELAESIRKKGLLEEILVRPKDDYFEIVHGERRWRACKLLGLKTIKAKKKELSDKESFELSLIENIQRENLLPIEEAIAYRKFADKGLTHEEIARKVDKTRTYITQKLRILKLPYSVQILLKENSLSEGHVRQLLRLEDIIGRHENLKKVKPFWKDFLNIGKYPFKSWVAFYQDYFAWHYHRDSVSSLKEKIDSLYGNILMATMMGYRKMTVHEQQEGQKALNKDKQRKALDGYENNLVHVYFENLLIKRMGLSKKTFNKSDLKFFGDYYPKHCIGEDWRECHEE